MRGYHTYKYIWLLVKSCHARGKLVNGSMLLLWPYSASFIVAGLTEAARDPLGAGRTSTVLK